MMPCQLSVSRRAAGAAVVLAATLACAPSEPTGTEPPARSLEEPIGAEPPPATAWDASPARTDSLVYHLQRESGAYRAYARVALRNRTAGPIHFARCMPSDTLPMFGLRRTGPDSTRTFFVDWVWACVGGVPTGELRRGDSLVVRVPLGSFDQPRMSPPLLPEHLTGLLRVRFSLCHARMTDSDYCEPLPEAEAQSNAFEVRY